MSPAAPKPLENKTGGVWSRLPSSSRMAERLDVESHPAGIEQPTHTHPLIAAAAAAEEKATLTFLVRL